MRIIFYIILIIIATSCTSTRSLSKKFSGKTETVEDDRWRGDFENLSIVEPQQIVRRNTVVAHKKTTLWKQLSYYRAVQDTLPEVPEDAAIRLDLENKNMLKVSAHEADQLLASYTIPVRKRKNYFILKNKNRVIPIPILYFEIKEDKAILAPLQNGRLGIATYSGHTLWVLFMGAGKEGLFATEYQKMEEY